MDALDDYIASLSHNEIPPHATKTIKDIKNSIQESFETVKSNLSLLQKDVNKCHESLKHMEVESRINGIASHSQNSNSDYSREKRNQHESAPT